MMCKLIHDQTIAVKGHEKQVLYMERSKQESVIKMREVKILFKVDFEI